MAMDTGQRDRAEQASTVQLSYGQGTVSGNLDGNMEV